MSFLSSNYKNNIWKFYAYEFLRGVFFVSGVLFVFFTDWGGINQTQIQILQSWFMLCVFLAEVPTGVIADYWGRKQSLLCNSVIVLIAMLVYSSRPNFYIFMVGEMLFGIGIAFYSGAGEALLYDSLKQLNRTQDFKTAWGRTSIFIRLASGFSAIIGSFIASRIGLRETMLYSIIPVIFSIFIVLTLKEPPTKNIQESKRYLEIFRNGFRRIFHNKILFILTLDSAFVYSLAYFVIWLYQPRLKEIGIPILYFGYFSFLLNGIQVVISSFPLWFEKILGGKKSFLTFGAWGTAISFLLVGIFPSWITVIILILIGGGFGLTRRSIMASYFHKQIPSDERATTMSAVSMFRQIILVIFNPLVGLLVDWNLGLTLTILGIVGILIAAFSQVEEEMLLE